MRAMIDEIDSGPFLRSAERLNEALAASDAPDMFTRGLAVAARGHAQATTDVDACRGGSDRP
ncbi:MAG: hypothetical protein ACJAYU_000209 [Bradymonadia bacterium]|jgi:hypothetical protein